MSHPTAEEVCGKVAEVDPGIGRATVYRVLSSLEESGEALRVPIPDGADRFDITTSPHPHFKCRICKGVFDLPGVKQESASFPECGGFLIEGYSLLYTGVCPKCSENLPDDPESK